MSESVEIACRRCYGTGKLYTPIKTDGEITYICQDCNGAGKKLIQKAAVMNKCYKADGHPCHQKGCLECRIAELKERIQEAVEVFAGMEGFEAETAPEAYLQRILDQMVKALEGSSDD